MLVDLLSNSDSEEKIEYYEEFANKVHPDFYAVILSCSFALAKSYYNVATITSEMIFSDIKFMRA